MQFKSNIKTPHQSLDVYKQNKNKDKNKHDTVQEQMPTK